MMQAKDVPELPILRFLAEAKSPATYWPSEVQPTVADAVPGTPEKVLLAKMRALIKRGLVSGCACGCRGDFELTDAGRAELRE